MIRHIVMFKLKEGSSAGENTEKLRTKLNNLKERIPQIVRLETGKNFSTRPVAFDLVLVTDFKSKEDLQIYQDHPDHMKVVEFINEVNEKVAVVDYEI